MMTLRWAATLQNQQNECAPGEDSDQPGHPPSLISEDSDQPGHPKDPSFLRADSEDSDQTGRMPRLIWVFARRTLILLVLSCRGSDDSACAAPNSDRSFHQALYGGSRAYKQRWLIVMIDENFANPRLEKISTNFDIGRKIGHCCTCI